MEGRIKRATSSAGEILVVRKDGDVERDACTAGWSKAVANGAAFFECRDQTVGVVIRELKASDELPAFRPRVCTTCHNRRDVELLILLLEKDREGILVLSYEEGEGLGASTYPMQHKVL